MRQNALLRSGKGLETGTARKKTPVSVVAPVSAEERDDHFAIRNGVRCAGVHLIIDLHGAEGLNDIDLIERTLRRCVDAARLHRLLRLEPLLGRPGGHGDPAGGFQHL